MEIKFCFKALLKIVFAKTNAKDEPNTPTKKVRFKAGIPSRKVRRKRGGRESAKRDQAIRAALTLCNAFLLKITSIAPNNAEANANQNHMR